MGSSKANENNTDHWLENLNLYDQMAENDPPVVAKALSQSGLTNIRNTVRFPPSRSPDCPVQGCSVQFQTVASLQGDLSLQPKEKVEPLSGSEN